MFKIFRGSPQVSKRFANLWPPPTKGLFVDFWQLLKGCFVDFVDLSVANAEKEGQVRRFWGDGCLSSSDLQSVSQYSSHFISLQCVGPKCSNNES